MRSSESANNASRRIAVMIRYREGNRNAQPSTRPQNAISLGRQRSRAIAWDERSGSAVMSGSSRGRAAEQAVRAPDQNHDHDSVDDEWSHLRHVIFAGNVADAEQQRRKERPGDAGGTADGDHDQKVDHELERDRKSTRLNSSHANISYAVFCLKKKKNLIRRC